VKTHRNSAVVLIRDTITIFDIDGHLQFNSMAPSATASGELPPVSAIQEILDSSKLSTKGSHPTYLHDLALTIIHDLQFQHDWTALSVHTHSTLINDPLPRPIISGLPPKRAYIHPDEQIEIIKEEHKLGEKITHKPEREWVLPSHLQEKWSLAKFAAVFDGLDVVPPGTKETRDVEENPVGQQWRGKNRQKRLLLATLHDDSTVVYYIMHDGIVKPRQN
jgi:tRNA-splicing endonuclease subunit Sen15